MLIDQTLRRSLTSRSNDAGMFFRYGSFSLRIDYGLCNRVETGTLLVNLMLAKRAQAHMIQFEKREATFRFPVNGAAVGSARLVSNMATRSSSIQPFVCVEAAPQEPNQSS